MSLIPSLNLIEDPWIPVIRQDGSQDMITPWQITSQHGTNPIRSVASPRPDFNGALVQFLIGLCQTALPPENQRDWRKCLTVPPSPDELKVAFSPLAGAFVIGGDGPQFMQERGIEDKKIWQIDSLLIGMPEKEKIKDNTDWFQKRGTVDGLCPRCAALALFTLQTNAPGGGRGHMTSVRGGGPMTTLVLGETLWQTVWANVVDMENYSHPVDDPPAADDARLFPWMGEVRTSAGGEMTTPEDVHPCQVFWGLPRRILLDLEGASSGTCDLCGAETDRCITTFWTKPYGVKYAGWVHPLSPYYRNGKNSTELLPVHPQPGGITYQSWLGVVIDDRDEGKHISKVTTLIKERAEKSSVQELIGRKPSIWAYGYDMDNKKPRCWYEGTLPLLTIDDAWKEEFEETASGMIRAASEMAKNVQWCVKVALYDNPADVKGDLSVINARFLQATEGRFYDGLDTVARALAAGEDTLGVRWEWLKDLQTEAKTLFGEYSQIDSIDEINAQRAVKAWGLLNSPASKSNKKVWKALSLPDQKKSGKGER
ncbi:type I-E CRISPR-associated protein Cse1/CasA [Methanofollis formosanus]|uniref:Type I-E CRISPR-associated protein Cse1/CasA n=1 Tax=Methanofollis formosanus TaxID=299308 RepID=A0A8G1A3M6_9EURY|nr:type I-E CRISPR-associated protein Cse1/CasA [Methanofollis formosanus]QYZ80138.1 type I-E CRISPR-associated protein Cse1/CasA [Methanofollis formosanus]